MTKRKGNAALIIVAVLACLLLAELALRVLDEPTPSRSGWRFSGRSSETNQLGFRGHPIRYSDDDYVIVLMGDSQVTATACAYEWMPERRLQHYLNDQRGKSARNVKVFTLGTEGYGQDQQLLVLQEYYRSYRADLVVLWQTPRNDVWNNMFPTHWPANGWPKPTFRLVNNELSGPTSKMGEPVRPTNLHLLALLDRFVPLFDQDGAWETQLPPPYQPISTSDALACDDWQQRYDQDVSYMRGENLQNEKSHLAFSLTPISKRTQYGLDLTKRLMRAIEETALKNGGRFVVFHTDDRQERSDRPECTASAVVQQLNNKYYATSHDQYWRNLNYINGGFVSFTVPVTINAWRRGPEDGHLNEHAVDQVMRDLAVKLSPLIR